MGDIISIRTTQPVSRRELSPSTIHRRSSCDGLISPPSGHIEQVIAEEHSGEPIKSLADIRMITDWLKGEGRYRDNMLFICGINFGLRISDLLQLQFFHLIDESFTFRTTFPILEKKTSNTRKVKRNRYITINEAVEEAVMLYLEHTQGCSLDDYLFRSESNRGSNQRKPLSRKSADRILKDIASSVGLKERISTHSLRKTFGYHQMMMSNNDPRKLLLLQKIYGHSSSAQTLDYIGLTREEIEDAYLGLNLGAKHDYASFGVLREDASVTA